MHRLTSRLVLFGDIDPEGILAQMSEISACLEEDPDGHRDQLLARSNAQVRRLLDLACTFGFAGNLWHCYLAFLLLMSENPFSLTAERRQIREGSLTSFALSDLKVFLELLHYDFSKMEAMLGISHFTALASYRAIERPAHACFEPIASAVRDLAGKLSVAQDALEAYRALSDAYRASGVGMLGLNRAFRICETQQGRDAELRPALSAARARLDGVELVAVNDAEGVLLSDLVGYDLQKEQLLGNTEAFLRGEPANNVLLYGDAGTGKSTSVKALLSEYRDSGLRVIELHKHQFRALDALIASIKNRNYRFIVFIDDLSFEENEVEYKYLKAVIEGGLESRPENVLIYATSNRRHLIRETWGDRDDMEHDGDIHRSDTIQEKTSLAARFGLAINYSKPSWAMYHEIVKELAERQLAHVPEDEELFRLADRWAMRHGGMTGRSAQQFINAYA